MGKQVETFSCSYKYIMRTKQFNLGVNDIIKNKGWNVLYETWDTNKQWCYERGRLYALHTKGQVPVKKNKAVTNDAIYAYVDGKLKNIII